jgi:multiple antibiotic resistance protein
MHIQKWRDYAEMATALFVIANPIGSIPVFITLTGNQNEDERRHSALVAAQTVAAVLILSIFAGEPLLALFGVSVASFRVGGGILILLMAISMLQARPSRIRHTPEETAEAEAKSEIAVVPIGIPVVAGPGAISTVIIYAHQATEWFDLAVLVVTSLFVAASVWIALRLANPIGNVLGKAGINIVTRLFGLILAAVAVEFITQGLAELLPGLATRM